MSNFQFMVRQCPSAAHDNSPSVHFSACQSGIKYLHAYSFLWSFLDPLYSVLILTRVLCIVNGPTCTGDTWTYWKKSKVGPPMLKSPMKGLKHSSYGEGWACRRGGLGRILPILSFSGVPCQNKRQRS